MIDNRAVGKAISTLRQNRNMTQQQLAAVLNVSHQAVSKWENGAALPDVQTLMDLSRLFGITMDQLLKGEVPQDRFENRSAGESTLQNIGYFFNNIMNGIFQPEAAKDAPEADDGAQEAEATGDQAVETEDTGEAGEAEKPSEAGEGDAASKGPANLDLRDLLKMAPFMSRQTVDELLMQHREKLTAADIARFAPYISQECLEKLIQNPETEITWETLQRVAPFLKREMVDRLAKVAAAGSRMAREVASAGKKNNDDLGKTLEDVSRTIGRGVDKAIRKAGKLGEGVASEVSNAWNSFVEGAKGKDARVAALRRAAQERALQDERWDWLAAHIDEITDESLRRAIADRANALGMGEWVLEHLGGYVDVSVIDAAVEAGNWDWLGDHAWQFNSDVQEKLALAAARAENWQWLADYAEQLSLDQCADRIAIAVWQAGQTELALQLAAHSMSDVQREALANEMAAQRDYESLNQLADGLKPEYFGHLCVARAQEKDWDTVRRFIEKSDAAGIEKMMELAIAEGNFDAIDLLCRHL